jgi:hypothetical protein
MSAQLQLFGEVIEQPEPVIDFPDAPDDEDEDEEEEDE